MNDIAKDSAYTALSELSEANATDWQNVGRVLTALEREARLAPDGDQWINKLQERLKSLGKPMSIGHLHKVRRAYGFLITGIRLLGIPENNSSIAKVSSIEIAERLYQLNSKAGLDALDDCLDPKKPATAADIKKRYDSFLKEHPNKKSAMHAAWEQRKKGGLSPLKTTDQPEGGSLSSLIAVVSQVQKEAHQKDKTIEELQDELAETKRLLAEKEQEFTMVWDLLKEAER